MFEFKPNGVSEANITAELYTALKKADFMPYLEYTHKPYRFDCILVNELNQVYAIIEVKRFKSRKLSILQQCKQIQNYSQFGVPVFFINARPQIPRLIRRIKHYLRTLATTRH